MHSLPQNRLAGFCDAFVEAGWLAIAVTLPLYVNTRSLSAFEPDKIFLFRSLVTAMTAARAVKLLAGGLAHEAVPAGPGGPATGRPHPFAAFLKRPLSIPALLAAGASILGSAMSLSPRISFWGSYQRAQGTYTLLCSVALFFLLREGLRSPERLSRFKDALLLASFPAALYALVQHAGLDPLPWARTVTIRATSTQGNPIFLGGYLVLLIPLTLSRILELWKQLLEPAAAPRDWRRGLGGGILSAAGLLALLLCAALRPPFWIGAGIALAAVACQVLFYSAIPPQRLYRTLCIGLPVFFCIATLSLWRFETFTPRAGPAFLWAGLFSAGAFIPAMGALAFFYRRPAGVALRLAVHALILSAQAGAILVTRSRGPLLALLAILALYLVMVGWARRRLWIAWLAIAMAAALAGFLLWLNTADSQAAGRVRQSDLFARIGKVHVAERTVKVRLFIWSGIVDLLRADPRPPFPDLDGRPDPYQAVRHLCGYGPESLALVFHPFYPPALAHFTPRGSIPDRAHNQTLELLATEGLFGLAAYLALIAAILYTGLQKIGLTGTSRQKQAFWGCVGGGTLAGGWASISSGSAMLAGLGLAGGLIAGLGAYLVALLALAGLGRTAPGTPGGEAEWPCALVAALVGHVIETHMGFPTATTGFLFWALAAMLAAGADGGTSAGEPQRGALPQGLRPPGTDSGTGLVTALMLGTLVFGFFPAAMGNPLTGPAAQPSGLAPLKALPALSGLLLSTLCAGALAGWPTGAPARGNVCREIRGMLRGAAIACGACGVFFLVLWAAQESGAAGSWTTGLWQTVLFYLFVLVVLSSAAAFRLRGQGPAARPAAGSERVAITRVFLGMGILASAAGVIYATNIRSALADVLAREGKIQEQRRQWHEATRFYQWAIDAEPMQAAYHSALGLSLEAGALASAADRERKLELSERAHLAALRLSPRDPRLWVNLARLYGTWSLLTTPAERSRRLGQSLAHFEEAVRRAPASIDVLTLWGQGLAASGDLAGAENIYSRAQALDPAHGPTYLLLGELYVRGENWPAARDAYSRAAERMPRSVEAHSGLGFACIKTGERDLALAAYRRAVALAPENHNDHKNLALLFEGSGEIGRAISAAHTAWQLAPEPHREALKAYLQSLRGVGDGERTE